MQVMANQAPEFWQLEFFNQLEGLLGIEQRLAAETRLIAVSEALEPLLTATRKDSRGRVDSSAAVGAMHEVLNQRHGIRLSGSAADGPPLSKPPTVALGICEHLPSIVCDLLYKYFDNDSLDLDEIALLTATTEVLLLQGEEVVSPSRVACDDLGDTFEHNHTEHKPIRMTKHSLASQTFEAGLPEPNPDQSLIAEGGAQGHNHPAEIASFIASRGDGSVHEEDGEEGDCVAPAPVEASVAGKNQAIRSVAPQEVFELSTIGQVLRGCAFFVAFISSIGIFRSSAKEVAEDWDTFKAATVARPAAAGQGRRQGAPAGTSASAVVAVATAAADPRG